MPYVSRPHIPDLAVKKGLWHYMRHVDVEMKVRIFSCYNFNLHFHF